MADMSVPTIVWFREDLRLSDNPALAEAVRLDGPIVPLFVLERNTGIFRKRGSASKWWLHHSLERLAEQIEKRGNRLILRAGDPVEIISQFASETGAARASDGSGMQRRQPLTTADSVSRPRLIMIAAAGGAAVSVGDFNRDALWSWQSASHAA